MNCPQCSNGLISVKMRKDGNGCPIFTLRCPEHGDVGEKEFKRAFHARIEQPIALMPIHTWLELISIIVREAMPNGFDRLHRQVVNENLAGYFRGVRDTLAYNMPRERPRSHFEIGQCGGCDAKFLYAIGYRISSCAFPDLGETDARALMDGCIDRLMFPSPFAG